jgi:transposase InsO family protein
MGQLRTEVTIGFRQLPSWRVWRPCKAYHHRECGRRSLPLVSSRSAGLASWSACGFIVYRLATLSRRPASTIATAAAVNFLASKFEPQSQMTAASTIVELGGQLRSITDQGVQFTSTEYVGAVEQAGVQVSMDGRGRWMDNGSSNDYGGASNI